MPRDYAISDRLPTAHQRLPEYARDEAWVRAFLMRAQIAHIATHWESQPFVTPSTFLYDEGRHRLIFHTNATGRTRSNIERFPEVCAEVSELGRFLPSNVALEFSLQYRSVVVFGKAGILHDRSEQRDVMEKLIAKYFGELSPGIHFRPPTEKELQRTAVYEVGIESWSGKENWKDRADQSDDWPALPGKWFL